MIELITNVCSWDVRTVIRKLWARVESRKLDRIVTIVPLNIESVHLTTNNWHAGIHCSEIANLFLGWNIKVIQSYQL